MADEQTNHAQVPEVPARQGAPRQAECPGDCMHCNPLQRTYCAVKISYDTQQILGSLYARIEALENSIAGLCQQVEQLKPAQEELIAAPTVEIKTRAKKKG